MIRVASESCPGHRIEPSRDVSESTVTVHRSNHADRAAAGRPPQPSDSSFTVPLFAADRQIQPAQITECQPNQSHSPCWAAARVPTVPACHRAAAARNGRRHFQRRFDQTWSKRARPARPAHTTEPAPHAAVPHDGGPRPADSPRTTPSLPAHRPAPSPQRRDGRARRERRLDSPATSRSDGRVPAATARAGRRQPADRHQGCMQGARAPRARVGEGGGGVRMHEAVCMYSWGPGSRVGRRSIAAGKLRAAADRARGDPSPVACFSHICVRNPVQ
jgi:hypothetical protein